MQHRKELVEKLMWNQGGTGFGVCSMANAFMWAMDRPGPGKPDLKSVVAICGEPKKYTTEELELLVEFSTKATERYDKMFSERRGCNLILIDKRAEGSWMRKRLTWEMGPMYSPTLQEALEVFKRDWKE
jgi:hypothetical protein